MRQRGGWGWREGGDVGGRIEEEKEEIKGRSKK